MRRGSEKIEEEGGEERGEGRGGEERGGEGRGGGEGRKLTSIA